MFPYTIMNAPKRTVIRQTTMPATAFMANISVSSLPKVAISTVHRDSMDTVASASPMLRMECTTGSLIRFALTRLTIEAVILTKV